MIISRKQAAREGRSTYYTDKPCKQGHRSERYTVNGSCVECQKDLAGWYGRVKKSVQKYAAAPVMTRVECHPDDVNTIRAFAKSLMIQRQMRKP